MIDIDKARKISSANMGGVSLNNNGHLIKKTLKYIESQIILSSRLGRVYCKIGCERFYDCDLFTSALIEKISKKGFKVDLTGKLITISW